MVEIICRDRQKLNELQTDVTGYVLAEVNWSFNNEAHGAFY